MEELREKPKGEGLYMNSKPKALGEGVGDNVFKKALKKLKKKNIKYFWSGRFSWKI